LLLQTNKQQINEKRNLAGLLLLFLFFFFF
jgi:hypothetical protein